MKLLIENWNKFLNEKQNAASMVASAFQNTDPKYLEDTLSTRTAGPGAAGSTFSGPTSIQDLIQAGWQPHPHPAINTSIGAIGFKAAIPGVLGIADIDEAPDEVVFQPAHGGKAMTKEPNPQTGEPEVLAEVVADIPAAAREVRHTTLIIGPSREDKEKLQVWTFHPGDPTPQLPEITMREVKERYNTTEDRIRGSKQDAVDMGYGFVKHGKI
mgnify:CR=1 FL=1|tara:strand:+ start:6110 stop:6748 length:639 start_codon:yes stop_codon:yes gene_type:complete